MEDAEKAFVAALERDPDDEATRAVYVDWLEERSRSEDARLVRAEPPPRAFTRLVQRELVARLRPIGEEHGRWALGCAIEIASWRPASPYALVEDAEHFVRTRRWDPAEGEPVAARAALLGAIGDVRERRVRTTILPPASGIPAQLRAESELVVQTALQADPPDVAPPSPIDCVVTIGGGYLQYLGTAGSDLVRLDAVDEDRLALAAFGATMQPWEYDGAPDTARVRSVTTVRLTHSDPRRSRSISASILTLSELASETSSPDSYWRMLITLVEEILRPRIGPPTVSWQRLVARCAI